MPCVHTYCAGDKLWSQDVRSDTAAGGCRMSPLNKAHSAVETQQSSLRWPQWNTFSCGFTAGLKNPPNTKVFMLKIPGGRTCSTPLIMLLIFLLIFLLTFLCGWNFYACCAVLWDHCPPLLLISLIHARVKACNKTCLPTCMPSSPEPNRLSPLEGCMKEEVLISGPECPGIVGAHV